MHTCKHKWLSLKQTEGKQVSEWGLQGPGFWKCQVGRREKASISPTIGHLSKMDTFLFRMLGPLLRKRKAEHFVLRSLLSLQRAHAGLRALLSPTPHHSAQLAFHDLERLTTTFCEFSLRKFWSKQELIQERECLKF